MARKVIGIDLSKTYIMLHCVDDADKPFIDETIIAVRWKGTPALQKLVQAFAEAAAYYVIEGNTNLEKLDKEELDKLFENLLRDDEDVK